MQEFCVKRKDRVEVVAMIGVFGMIVSVAEMYPFSIFLSSSLWSGFIACFSFFFSLKQTLF